MAMRCTAYALSGETPLSVQPSRRSTAVKSRQQGKQGQHVLYGLGILPLGRHGWSWISGIAVAGAVLMCCGLEMLMGKYTARHS
jgi:hypothetical protein